MRSMCFARRSAIGIRASDADQAEGSNPIVFFHDFVRQANQCALDFGGRHDLPFFAKMRTPGNDVHNCPIIRDPQVRGKEQGSLLYSLWAPSRPNRAAPNAPPRALNIRKNTRRNHQEK